MNVWHAPAPPEHMSTNYIMVLIKTISILIYNANKTIFRYHKPVKQLVNENHSPMKALILTRERERNKKKRVPKQQ